MITVTEEARDFADNAIDIMAERLAPELHDPLAICCMSPLFRQSMDKLLKRDNVYFEVDPLLRAKRNYPGVASHHKRDINTQHIPYTRRPSHHDLLCQGADIDLAYHQYLVIDNSDPIGVMAANLSHEVRHVESYETQRELIDHTKFYAPDEYVYYWMIMEGDAYAFAAQVGWEAMTLAAFAGIQSYSIFASLPPSSQDPYAREMEQAFDHNHSAKGMAAVLTAWFHNKESLASYEKDYFNQYQESHKEPEPSDYIGKMDMMVALKEILKQGHLSDLCSNRAIGQEVVRDLRTLCAPEGYVDEALKRYDFMDPAKPRVTDPIQQHRMWRFLQDNKKVRAQRCVWPRAYPKAQMR